MAVLLVAAVLVDSKPPPQPLQGAGGGRPSAADATLGPLTSSPMLVLTRSDVEALLDLEELEDALARAHEELSSGAVSMPPRIAALANDAGLLGAMPAYLPSAGLGCKLVTLFPGNTDRPTHQAAIMLFDPDTGTPIALMDGTYVTEARTAGAAALAARLLARDDATVLAILGTGAQARAHVARVRGRARLERGSDRGPRRRRRRESSPPSSARRPRPRSRRPSAAPTSSPRRRTRASRSCSLGVALARDARQLGRRDAGRRRGRPGDRGRRDARRRDPRGTRAAAGRRVGARRSRRLRRPRRARGARLRRSTRPNHPRRNYSVQVSRRRGAGPGGSGPRARCGAGARRPASRSSWRRFTHDRVQPRPRRRRRLRDGDRRARPRRRPASLSRRRHRGSRRAGPVRAGVGAARRRVARAGPAGRVSGARATAPAITCPTSRLRSPGSAASGTSAS